MPRECLQKRARLLVPQMRHLVKMRPRENLRSIGGDAVGMSSVPEAIVAVHCGLRILGLSAISNLNLPDCPKPAPLEDVLANAKIAGQKMIHIVEGLLGKL